MTDNKVLYIATPRGFCAGVDRAIDVVELALEVYGAPVYVKHAIVHNTHVVKRLKKKGAHFTDMLTEIPERSHVVFSAHGSPPEHYALARRRSLHIIDATCPLVTKVHLEVKRFSKLGYDIIMIGHKGHVEPVGTLGNAQNGINHWLIDSVKEAETIAIPNPNKLAVVTQTTLSLDETKEILRILRKRFSKAEFPKKEDICYATTNRQQAVKQLLPRIDVLIVVGSKTSSNSKRLQEVGARAGVASYLIDDVSHMKTEWFKYSRSVCVTSGASAPEDLVQEVSRVLLSNGFILKTLDNQSAEDVFFSLPHEFVREISEFRKGQTIIQKHTIKRGRAMKT